MARHLVVVNWRDRAHREAGGAELVCEELARHFVSEGWQVTHLSAAVPGRAAEERRDGIRYVRRGGRFGVYPRALVWLVRNRQTIDAVLDSQNGIPFFTPLAVTRRTPVLLVLYHVHQDQFAMYFPRAIAALGRFLEGPCCRLVYGRRAIVAISPSTRDAARRRLGLRGDILVAAPGITMPLPRHVPRATTPEICWVGRLVPHKRVSVLIDAFAELVRATPAVRLNLVGDGPLRAELLAQVEKLGIGDNVQVHGSVCDDERDRLLARSWLVVSTSTHEGWGLTVIEANALGTPVVALRRPGLVDSVRDGETGWLVEDEDELPAALERAIKELDDPLDAAAWSERARSWASGFTWSTMGQLVGCQLAKEEQRLYSSPRSARANDGATLAVLARLELPPDWRAPLEPTDHIAASSKRIALLLRGVAPHEARTLLERSGAGAVLTRDDTVIRAATDIDLVSPPWALYRSALSER